MDTEKLKEQKHLEDCLEIVRENIRQYEKKEQAYKEEVKSLFQNVRKGEGDSYGALVAGQNILEHTQNSLRKNRAALKKVYFGRVDYWDETYHTAESCYIGKNGITRNQTDVIIVDWRAPVSSVYYENELGEGSYDVPGAASVSIDLKKKRTYDISGEELLGFYDDDVAANDELLVKYLSQNKEAVLGDIIATIQKEQNEIIRAIPFKNIIVQGVAGSGKTTVALHRISYLLYNYEERYKPSEFCIVGSSDMLLNYISSGLPELDVNHVEQMRMDRFIPYLMGKAWKKKYKLIADREDAPIKSKLRFVRELEGFLEDWRQRALPVQEILDDQMGVVLSCENIAETIRTGSRLSLMQLEKLMNTRIISRVKFLCTEAEDSFRKEKLSAYRKYFDSGKHKWTELQIYDEFLKSMEDKYDGISFEETRREAAKGILDIYDAAAVALIWKRIFVKKDTDEFSQIIIDEAQDFGEMIYFVLRQILPECYFTVMGDVSQNIRYDTGMNDWDGLKEALFDGERDSFYLLAKSYRNTIEISECAGKVLEKASQGSYKIQPVIRHGKPVDICRIDSGSIEECLRRKVRCVQDEGYETIAVVCRTDEEAREVRGILGIHEEDQDSFRNGVMVLPVTLTKGLEFDAVILWKPDEAHYGRNPREAKLLYVAITRALHELHMILDDEPSRLLD